MARHTFLPNTLFKHCYTTCLSIMKPPLLKETEIYNYVDDATIYAYCQELEQIVSSLENDAQRISKWFLYYSVKLRPDKHDL